MKINESDSTQQITLAHGGGGQLTHSLLIELIADVFGDNVMQDDQARLSLQSTNLAFSTDSFVVSPRRFNGGDIGCLSVFGTVNDLVVGGAVARFISCAFIIEEGFSIAELKDICQSMKKAAQLCGVDIVCGDTKVVPKGQCEGIYINTSGIGQYINREPLDMHNIAIGDKIIVSRDIGRHGACIAATREEYGLDSDLQSDCGSLHRVSEALLRHAEIKYMRDATRGGVAAVLNELAGTINKRFAITESAIPTCPEVDGICELLGFNPLHLANEGCLIAIVSEQSCEKALNAISELDEAQNAACIGEVCSTENNNALVTLKSVLGVDSVLASPNGELLPRIC